MSYLVTTPYLESLGFEAVAVAGKLAYASGLLKEALRSGGYRVPGSLDELEGDERELFVQHLEALAARALGATAAAAQRDGDEGGPSEAVARAREASSRAREAASFLDRLRAGDAALSLARAPAAATAAAPLAGAGAPAGDSLELPSHWLGVESY